MCIICIKNKGVAMPTDETMRIMFNYNSDGAGYMYPKDGQVKIRKGFMTLASLQDSLKSLAETENIIDLPIVLHFRIGTAGGNIQANTHPFPLSGELKALQKLRLTCGVGIVHNGIINIHTSRTDISDTMEYIMSQMSLMYKMAHNFYKNPIGQKMVENAIGSKMAILDGNGDIFQIGDFITDKDTSLVYSNSTYKSAYLQYYGSYNRSYCDSGYYDDDEYDDDYFKKGYHTVKKDKVVRRWLTPVPDNCSIVVDKQVLYADESLYYIGYNRDLFEYNIDTDFFEYVGSSICYDDNDVLFSYDINASELCTTKGGI